MNIYLLVEGRNTERILYSSWLTQVLPGHVLITDFEAPTGSSIYCFTGGGFPSVIDRAVPNAVADLNRIGTYDVLLVVFDSDDADVEQLTERVHRAVENAGGLPARMELVVVVQKRCIESWLLGNRVFIPRMAQTADLIACKRFYDVSTSCPEVMECPSNYSGSTSVYHAHYLRAAFRERGCLYTKSQPGDAATLTYFRHLRSRYDAGDLPSMRPLFEFLDRSVVVIAELGVQPA